MADWQKEEDARTRRMLKGHGYVEMTPLVAETARRNRVPVVDVFLDGRATRWAMEMDMARLRRDFHRPMREAGFRPAPPKRKPGPGRRYWHAWDRDYPLPGNRAAQWIVTIYQDRDGLWQRGFVLFLPPPESKERRENKE